MTAWKYDRLKTLKRYDSPQNPTGKLPGGSKSPFPIPFFFLNDSLQSPCSSIPWSLLEATYQGRGPAELSQHCALVGNLNHMDQYKDQPALLRAYVMKFCSVMQVEKQLLIILPLVLAHL